MSVIMVPAGHGTCSKFGSSDLVRTSSGKVPPKNTYTVEPVITHTPQWMAEAMGYYRSWLSRGGLKIDLKAIAKFLGWNMLMCAIDITWDNCELSSQWKKFGQIKCVHFCSTSGPWEGHTTGAKMRTLRVKFAHFRLQKWPKLAHHDRWNFIDQKIVTLYGNIPNICLI